MEYHLDSNYWKLIERDGVIVESELIWDVWVAWEHEV